MTPDTERSEATHRLREQLEDYVSTLAIVLLFLALAWPPLVANDAWRQAWRVGVGYLALLHVVLILRDVRHQARRSRIILVNASGQPQEDDHRRRASRHTIPVHHVLGLIACGFLLLLLQPRAPLSTTTTPSSSDAAVTKLTEAVDRLGARLQDGGGDGTRGGGRSDALPPETEITKEGEAIVHPRPRLPFWLFLALFGSMFAGGLFLSTSSVSYHGPVAHRYRKALGLALSTGSLFGGLTLVKFDTVSLALPPVAIEVGRGASSYERLATISSFKPGVADQLEGLPGGGAEPEVTAASLARVRGELRRAFEQQARGRTLRALMVVGFADRFEVRRAVQSRFGSNAGLARARADWVSAQAADRSSPFPRVDQIILTAGHGRHGDAAVSDTAVDRSVVIYAMWDETLRSRLNWLRPTPAPAPEPPRQTAAAP